MIINKHFALSLLSIVSLCSFQPTKTHGGRSAAIGIGAGLGGFALGRMSAKTRNSDTMHHDLQLRIEELTTFERNLKAFERELNTFEKDLMHNERELKKRTIELENREQRIHEYERILKQRENNLLRAEEEIARNAQMQKRQRGLNTSKAFENNQQLSNTSMQEQKRKRRPIQSRTIVSID